MRDLTCLVAVLSLAALPAAAADAAPGKAAFDQHCSECHAPGVGHPGTQMLGWTRGPDQAVLEQRKTLTQAYVTFVARHGLAEMPPFRPTELSDADLQSIARYLASPGVSGRR